MRSTLSMLALASIASAFTSIEPMVLSSKSFQRLISIKGHVGDSMDSKPNEKKSGSTRKAFLSSAIATTTATMWGGYASADEEGFESIAERAAKISKMAEKEEAIKDSEKVAQVVDPRTSYDFTLPIAGEDVPFKDLIKQEFTTIETPGENEGEIITKTEAKVKAILVVNMKQDDPIARRNIPELITLASKFGRNGEFTVVCSPTDQGYFEPDTSALIRLKLASEYGFGINPATIVTDKLNLLGTGAHPYWRYIEGTCRAPSGLGRIQGNFEKFLVDGRTGKAVRRYPRKYQPFDIAEDIDALMKGKPLPPAGANWKEEWRNSDKESERDVYRFQKGLNVFDQ